jgi:hypothetical protein
VHQSPDPVAAVPELSVVLAPAAVAVIEVAVTVPFFAVTPTTVMVSPSPRALALALAVRVIFTDGSRTTVTMSPAEFVR